MMFSKAAIASRFFCSCKRTLGHTGRSNVLVRVSNLRVMTMSTGQVASNELDTRNRLTTELKSAMKSKDKFTSTILRSVLAEVYNADKKSSGAVPNSQVVSIIRKAIARRIEAAAKFAAASRYELVKSERAEADYLATFLPREMSEDDVDALLNKLAVEHDVTAMDRNRALGTLIKEFFGQVDKALADGRFVKQRAEVVLDRLREE